MNLVIIGNDTDKIALDIWKGNTNFTVLNKDPCLWGSNFLSYIDGKEIIVSTSDEQFKTRTINQFLEYMDKHAFIPIFIADDKDSFVNTMYTAVNELIPDAVLFTRNEKNEGYRELIEIAREYLFKRKESNDKTVRTPRKRKASTSKK